VYLHVSPEEVIFGADLRFEEARLDRWRKLLHNLSSAERLEAALAAAKKGGLKAGDLGQAAAAGARLRSGGPRAELSKYKAGGDPEIETPPGSAPGALGRAETAARAYAPLHAWMRDELCP